MDHSQIRSIFAIVFVLSLPKEKSCWCTQNYLWDVW